MGFKSLLHLYKCTPSDGVDRDCGGESGHGAQARRQRQNVSPGSIPMSQFTSTVPIHPVWLGTIYLSRHTQPCLDILLHLLKNSLAQSPFAGTLWHAKMTKMSKFWNNLSKTVQGTLKTFQFCNIPVPFPKRWLTFYIWGTNLLL